MTTLASEAGTVQFPLIHYAEAAGWTAVSEAAALGKRRGEEGLFFYDELEAALLRLNPGVVTPENVQAVIQRMESVPVTIEGNRELLRWLRGEQTLFVELEKRHRHVRVLDYENIENNVFQVTWEWTCRNPRKANRADVAFVINGVPVAIVENKNPMRQDAMHEALVQLRRYELQTPEMLVAPQVFNITHLIEYFYGVTWNYNRNAVFNWKQEARFVPSPFKGEGKDKGELDVVEHPHPNPLPSRERGIDSYGSLVGSFFERGRFLRLLRDWILFYVKDDELLKTVLRQHQVRAAQKVVRRCADAERKTGLIWHTQGSGKTFTMLTAARLILEDKTHFPGATVMLVVDRNELEGQLSGWVERLLGEMQNRDIAVARADSRARLQELLDQDFRGLIISMIHKFNEIRKNSCTRRDF
ncbi:MAG: type I restriction endonuclease, partial [Gammaproteobacteria bacterium]